MKVSCGYGKKPENAIGLWIIFVILLFPSIYYFSDAVVKNVTNPSYLGVVYNSNSHEKLNWIQKVQQSVYFSIVTATTLGYGDYKPKEGFFQMVAGAEAVFGTLMWAVFIAVIARKYMR